LKGGDWNVFRYAGNDSINFIDASGLDTDPNGAKASCYRSCEAIFKKPKAINGCKTICDRLKDTGQPRCTNLKEVCEHLDGHGGKYNGGRGQNSNARMCWALYDSVCPDNRPTPYCRFLAECNDGELVVISVLTATVIVGCIMCTKGKGATTIIKEIPIECLKKAA